MKASEFIKELQGLIEKHGDLEMVGLESTNGCNDADDKFSRVDYSAYYSRCLDPKYHLSTGQIIPEHSIDWSMMDVDCTQKWTGFFILPHSITS